MAGYTGLTDAELDAKIAALSQPPSSASPTSPATRPPDASAGAVDVWLGSDQAAPTPISDEELDRQIAELLNTRPMSTGEDVGRSGVTGLQKGLAGLVGLPGDIQNLWGQGVDNGMSWLLEKAGQITPEKAKAIRDEKYDYAASNGLANSSDINTLNQKAFGAYHEPQTSAGGYAQTLAEMAPNMLAPGGPLGRLASMVVPGLLSEGGGQLTRGTKAEPWARAGGALLGGALHGGATALARSPEQLAGEAIRGATQPQLTAAGLLMHDAQARGVQLTWAEALQQTTNSGTGAGRLQRVVEGTKQGQERLGPMMAQRPAQTRGAVMDFADQLSPHTAEPSALGPVAKRAAQGGVDDVRGSINQRTQHLYDALDNQHVPPAEYQALTADPSYARALAEVRGNAELNGPIAHLPDQSLTVVNEVQKQLDTLAEGARQTVNNPAGNNRLAGLRGDARTSADLVARDASQQVGGGEYGQARDAQAILRAQELAPLEAGPAGQIAATDQVPGQTAALYPKAPLEGAPQETAAALRAMAGRDPQIGADLTRQHVVNTFNEASQDLQPGANQWAGPKFAATIAGNPEQRATLTAGLGEVAPNADYDALHEVLMAMGKREQAGSKTAFNAEDLRSFGQLPIPSPESLNPIHWPKALHSGAKDMLYRRNTNALADSLMLGPDESAQFLQGARDAPVDPQLIRMLLLGSGVGAGASQ